MREWARPTRKELALEALVALVIPAWNAAAAVIDGRDTHVAILTTLGALVLVLLIIAIWEWVRSPYRRRRLSDSELEDAIVRWVRSAGYGIAPPASIEGATVVVGATWNGTTCWLSKLSDGNVLTIALERNDTDNQIRSALTDEQWTTMLYEMALELGRFGASVTFDLQGALKISISETLTLVDTPVRERDLIDSVNFVRRADGLATLVARKHHAAQQFTQQATPPAQPATAAD